MVKYMGIMRVVAISISLTLIVLLVSSVLSIDVYLAAGAVVVGIVIFGLFAGLVGGIKISSHIERRGKNNNNVAAKSLAKDINKAHKTIRIVGGTANPVVYNDKKVRNAFNGAIKRGVRIQAVFSGIDFDKENTIVELAKKDEIRLYKPHENSVPRNHFRVVDALSVYSEKGHTKNEQTRYYERFDNIHNIAIKFEKAFDDIIDHSERMCVKNN